MTVLPATYAEAKAKKVELEAAAETTAAASAKFPKIRFSEGERPTPQAQKARQEAAKAKYALSSFNWHFARKFKAEIQKEKEIGKYHCQYCERAQEVVPTAKGKQLVIAHHGYQRPGGGYQTSSCICARELPYEVSCAALPPIIEGFKNQKAHHTAKRAEMLKTPPAFLPGEKTETGERYQTERGYWRHREIRVEYSALKPADFDPEKKLTGWEDEHSYARRFSAKRFNHEQSIQYATSEIKRLTKRVAEWKPAKEIA